MNMLFMLKRPPNAELTILRNSVAGIANLSYTFPNSSLVIPNGSLAMCSKVAFMNRLVRTLMHNQG